jgi:lysyl-tRNA synthetase class 2
MASLARPNPRKPWLAERFEIYLRGVEIANGFGELVDPLEQRRRFEADLALRVQLGRPTYPMDERFLRALEDGVPASAGVAVGVDRLLMLLLGERDIEAVLPFPFERA